MESALFISEDFVNAEATKFHVRIHKPESFQHSHMAKKRKAGGRPFGDDEPRGEREGNSKLWINSYEDVADSEDEFHINRDKILLEEGPVQKRQRKALEDGLFCVARAVRCSGG